MHSWVDSISQIYYFIECKNLYKFVKCYFKVDYLWYTGGGDYNECISNILYKILPDKLATQFCWEGIRKTNGKLPFKDLKIKSAIFSKNDYHIEHWTLNILNI